MEIVTLAQQEHGQKGIGDIKPLFLFQMEDKMMGI
jgi:hypothetical protein